MTTDSATRKSARSAGPSPAALALGFAVSSAFFVFAAFVLVLFIRQQLAEPTRPVPGLGWLFGSERAPEGRMLPELYNQLGAVHGTVMVFFGVVPLALSGLGTWLVPALIGSRRVAFPRLHAAGLLFHVAGGLLLLASLWAPGGAAQAGWTSYPPLSTLGTDGQTWWLVALLLAALSALLVSASLLVTVVQHRREGLGLWQMPFAAWTMVVSAFLELLALPPFAAGVLLQLADRHLGTSFFVPNDLVVAGEVLQRAGPGAVTDAASGAGPGGSPVLWQHLFWFLAHPEVYVLVLPALGVVAHLYQVHARNRLWGRDVAVGSVLFLGFVSFLVWAHHMFLTGMGPEMAAFFQITTMIVSVPSVVVGTSLLLTLWGASLRFTPPMLFALAFLPLFALGGLTGLPLGMAASDVHLHDTVYVVGHFHLLVGPGTLFALFAALYHWLPLWSGRRPNRLLAHLHFWPSLVGMISLFTHMLLQGLSGMPRRYWDGGALFTRWQDQMSLHDAATDGAWILAVGQLPFLVNVVWTLWRGEKDADPWSAADHDESPEWRAGGDDAVLESPRQPTPFGDRELGAALAGAAVVMFLAALGSAWIFLRLAGGGS